MSLFVMSSRIKDKKQYTNVLPPIVKGENLPEPGLPESFNVLIRELQGLGLDIELIKKEEEEGKHGSTAKMKKIISMLPSVEVFVGRVLSPNFIKMSQSTDIQPIIVKRESIEECLQVISQNFQTIYELTQKRKADKREQVVPAFE